MPTPVSMKRSLTSFSRTFWLLMRYSLRPSRYRRRATSTSSASTCSVRCPLVPTGFSKVKVTVAAPSGLRAAEPAKMTSSMAAPRSDLAERSPRTHLTASTTFDLPHPLGPTMPIFCSLKRKSTGSANDLKPVSVTLASLMLNLTSCQAFRSASPAGPHGGYPAASEKGPPYGIELSALATTETALAPVPGALRQGRESWSDQPEGVATVSMTGSVPSVGSGSGSKSGRTS